MQQRCSMSVPSNDFSPEVRDIFECFDFYTQVDRLAKSNLLYLVAEKFANIDFHPNVVSNARMGTVFEELIRKFAELSSETAGEHFTPREVAGSGRLGSQRHSSAGRGLEERTSRGERVFPAKSGKHGVFLQMNMGFRQFCSTLLQN